MYNRCGLRSSTVHSRWSALQHCGIDVEFFSFSIVNSMWPRNAFYDAALCTRCGVRFSIVKSMWSAFKHREHDVECVSAVLTRCGVLFSIVKLTWSAFHHCELEVMPGAAPRVQHSKYRGVTRAEGHFCASICITSPRALVQACRVLWGILCLCT